MITAKQKEYCLRVYNKAARLMYEADKHLHFEACLFSCFILIKLLELLLPTLLAKIIAGVLVFALGYWKEIRDKRSYGLFDNNDLKADMLGILSAVIMV